MDTQNQPASKLPSIRTYAKDLETKRKEKGLEPQPEAVTVAAEAPAPKESFLKKKPKVVSMPPIVVEKEKPESKPVPRPVPKPTVRKIDAATLSTFNTKNTTFIVDNEDAAAATIITDTKRDRFKFFPALFASMKEWFSDKQQSYKAKKQPKYTVAEASRRKGVIQRATGVTGKLASSDFSSIQERIKQRQEESEEKSHTTWSAKTEPGFLLLETSKKAAVANVQFVNRKTFRAVTPQVVPEVQKVVAPEPVPETVVTEAAPVTPLEVAPIVKPVEEVTPPEQAELEYEQPLLSSAVATKNDTRFGSILRTNTNTLSLIVSVVVLALTIAGTYTYFLMNETASEVPTLSRTEIKPLISSDQKLIALTAITKTAVFEALVDTRSSLDQTVQIAFVTNTEELIPPDILLSRISPSLEQTFSNTISQIRFGYTDNRQPFIVLQVGDIATAKGGMLAWEENLGLDFNSLFGITGVDFQTKFIDASLGGVDVRVLKSQSGTERLIYGVSGNTIIIATQSSDFTKLVN